MMSAGELGTSGEGRRRDGGWRMEGKKEGKMVT